MKSLLMENMDLQLNFEMMEDTEFEEKVDIDDSSFAFKTNEIGRN